MSDSSLSITTASGKVKEFEANSKHLETTTAWINFDKSNDFSVPIQLKEKDGTDGPKVYLRPDQLAAIKATMNFGSTRTADVLADIEREANGGSRQQKSISVFVGNQYYSIDTMDLQNQIANR